MFGKKRLKEALKEARALLDYLWEDRAVWRACVYDAIAERDAALAEVERCRAALVSGPPWTRGDALEAELRAATQLLEGLSDRDHLLARRGLEARIVELKAELGKKEEE